MRLIQLTIIPILFLGSVPAQRRGEGTSDKAIYFLSDEEHRQWCGYASESQMKAQVQALKAIVVGKLEYKNGRVSTVYVTEVDETGDWAVNDEYTLDDTEEIRALKRTINILPEDTSEEQVFLIEKGKATKKSSTNRELRTGKPTHKSVDWFEEPRITTSLKRFPFSVLISSVPSEFSSTGAVCVPNKSN